MVKEEISIGELLDKFKLELDLVERLLAYEISSDFLKSKLQKKDNKYIFTVDDVVLTINPSDEKETISNLLVIDGEVKGGVIIGKDSIQYLN